MASRDPDEPSALGSADTVTPALADTELPDTVAGGGPPKPPGGDPRDTVADTSEAKLGERPVADRVARAVARTRIANQMFAKQDHVRIGRYQLLEQVGAGGMGVVWGAWDPELERRVAIKLIKATLPAARERLQIEGQALARLSHPNVVTVHDVGVVDEQIYIVMEWVRGKNLRAYCRERRSLRDVLAIYRAAGDGLAAAHAVGLIHRDFKPDNAIVGDDGRVRVLDFGLARSDVRIADSASDASAGSPGASGSPGSELTRGAGTPRYMPPEQADGGALTAAVDQYAFCVSLREALTGRSAAGRAADAAAAEPGAAGATADLRRGAEIPRWIDAILTRGTARDPSARFPSMAELLRALARDPARVWRRRLIAAGALAATAAAFAIGSLRASHTAVEPCTGARAQIARAWNLAARAQLVGHLERLGSYGGGEASRLGGEFDRYAEHWAAAHRTACIASERGELTAQLYERNLSCLVRARVGFETAIDLMSRVPGDRLSNALVAARGLPDADRCLTETQARAVDPPPPDRAVQADALGNEAARLRVLAQAADPSVGAAAATLVARARELGYLPVLARAYLVQGLEALARSDGPAAVPVLDQAATAALDGGDQAAFVEAYAREVFAIATTPRTELPESAAGALGAIPYVEHIAHRLGGAGSFERALLFNNIGVSRMSAGDRTGARAWFGKAIDEPRARRGDVELASALGNLALVVDDPADRDRLFAREHDALAALLGADHIMALASDYKRSGFEANPEAAAARTRGLCQRAIALHRAQAAGFIGQCAYQLGWLAEERGDAAETRTAMQQVVGPAQAVAHAYVTAGDGKLAEAITEVRAAAAGLGAEWWTKLFVGDARLFAAICADRLHRTAEAITEARAALATYGEITVNQQAPYYRRRTSRARAVLARLLRASQPDEARALAGDAAAWYRAAGGYDAIAGEMDAIASRRE